MKNIVVSIFIISLFASLQSCKMVGININRETPKKGNDYPKFTHKDSLKGALNSYRTCFNVTEYYLGIEVLPKKKTIKGYVDIDFTVVEPCKKIQIDLYENMNIDSIVSKGTILKYSRNYGAVYVEFNSNLLVGQEKTIRVYYNGKPKVAPKPPWDGGFVWEKTEDKNPWIGVACELAGASLWWPCKDHISDEPENGVTIDVTVPEGLNVVSNGTLIKEETKNGKSQFVWETNYTINNYNVTLYIAKFQHFSETYEGVQDTFKLDYYVLPEHLEKAKETFKQTAGIIKFYEEIYGPYPWAKEGFKLVGSPYAGMEHQTAIAYGSIDDAETHELGFDYIILHETAHEWWGNSISVGDYSDIFMHEGFATYSEALYVERMYGVTELQNYMNFYGILVKNKNPIIGPRDVNFWDYNDTDPYLKGAWVLHGLRNVINDDSVFFKILKTFYLENKYSIVTTQDFTKEVNKITNTDYNWYFKQFLYDRRAPILEYRVVKSDEESVNIEMRWQNVANDFVLPVLVEVNDIPVRLKPTTTIQEFVLSKCETLSFRRDFAYYAIQRVTEFE